MRCPDAVRAELGAAPWLPVGAPVDPKRFVDGMEAAFGRIERFGRSTAKGICATGDLVVSADGRFRAANSTNSLPQTGH